MNPYRRPGRTTPHEEQELWWELGEALADSLRDPGWAAVQAAWVMQDAVNLGLVKLRRAAEAMIEAITT
jgi:hypothetical protein